MGNCFLDQLQSGATSDRRAVVEAYRQLADQLDRRLAVLELMHETAERNRETDRTNVGRRKIAVRLEGDSDPCLPG